MKVVSCLVAAATLCVGSNASAATILSLTLDTPTMTIGATDSINIRATLRNLGGEAFQVSGVDVLQGIDNGAFSANLGAGYTLGDIDRVIFGPFVSCEGTVGLCDMGAPYNFLFGTPPGNLTLDPGDSASLDFGQLVPASGSVAAGTYTIANLGLTAYALNPASQIISFYDLAETCPTLDESCAFSRTVAVSAIPEPGTWLMFIAGFGAIGGAMRYRKRTLRVTYS